MKVRNRVVLTGVAVALASSLTGCAGGGGPVIPEAAEGELTTVRLVSTMSWNSALAGMAVSGDFPEEFGLDFETVTVADAGSSNQVAALLAGSADVGSFGINTAIDAIMSGAALQIIGGASYIQQTIVASNEAIEKYGINFDDSPIERVGKLNGATIAAGPEGSSGNNSLRAILADAGLDPNVDVNIVPLADTSGAVAAGLENGVYDATFGPMGSGEAAALRGKAETILSVPAGEAEVLEGNINSVFVAPTKLIEEQPELVQRIRDSFRAAANLVEDDPDLARSLIRENIYPDMDEGVFDASWEMTRVGYPTDAAYGEDNWNSFVRIYAPLSENDYASLKFEDVVNAVATK
ncbi:ABC transporter substrate-binding protein [Salinibacterium sp. ZJ450]|uniref:ABC transporter substrate-binding protein n=1 Tax=Salinibacterium sp. ZJ450 TaxID=2708338 RepID=UPI0014246531|nr:ABC transporter substrate-binding protein [Salinibacterium sp. ZJ450]